MSGDVQPRKRKDKKRKKDDSQEQISSQSHSFNQSEDLNIHVHKEDGTGGGICAKIVFFILFSALAIVIGLIITEHRGLTDLDTADQESRFSQIFEGWTDNSIGHEHDEDDHIVDSLEDHEDEDHEEKPEESAEAEEEDDHEQEQEEDHDQEEQEEEEEEEEEEVAETEEEEEEEEEEEAEGEVSEEAPQTEEEEEEEEEEEAEEDEESNVSPIDEEDEDQDQDQDQEEEDVSEAKDEQSEEVDAKDEDEEQSEEATADEVEAEEAKEEEEGVEQQNSKMIVKIGVGVALLVVAHVVLVRKWKSATPSSDTPNNDEATPDLSRRNTIVVPPTLQQVEHDIEENPEVEYSDEDGEVESEEEHEHKTAKEKYQELRSTYTRSFTPESEPENLNKSEEEYEEEEVEDEEVEVEMEEDEDEEEESEGEYEREEDDDDLLKRLEARYGKLQRGNKADSEEDFDEQFSSWKRVNVGDDNEAEESESDKQSDPETYEYENVTNKDDLNIKDEIDEAYKNIHNNTAYAIKLFDVLIQKHPSSPRSLYGKAQALDVLADKKRSNELLKNAIHLYLQLLKIDKVPDALYEIVAERCINRMRFLGDYKGAIDVHQKLIDKFPNTLKFKNQLVVTYLTINRVNKARQLLQEILKENPNDGLALVHYGFILKAIDNKLNESVVYLRKGIFSKEPGVLDGRFYFHLGDALARLGQEKEAMKIYEDGVKHNLFLSKYQRSLYNVNRLKGQPWWEKTETPYTNLFKALETNWEKIRDEGVSVLNKDGLFQKESENLKDTGDWKQFELFARGQKNSNCKKCPFTCKIIESFSDAKGCTRGQTKFSVMHPGTHVWPHCGPTNCRLRVHLGLKVPPKTYIRVADEVRSWKEGEVFIFDDSFEHEVWHNGSSFRLVLIVDVWHPELTSREKTTLSPI